MAEPMIADDPITRDIRSAVRSGYFDRRREEGPSRLEQVSSLNLIQEVEMMSAAHRRAFLAGLGRFRQDRFSLLGGSSSPPRIRRVTRLSRTEAP